jgi:NADH-quinone oxidoreductase subunit N
MSSDIWRYLLPEIIVAITGAVILIVDLIWPAPKPAEEPAAVARRAWLAGLGIAGLLAAGVIIATQLVGVTSTQFSGIIVIDPLAVFFKFLFIAIAILVLLMSIEAVPKFSRWTAEFYALVVWCTLGCMLLASANELFTIFLCLQLTSLPLIVLIGFAKRDPKSGEAALKYLLLVLVSTAVLLYGMSLIYGSLGTSTLPEIGQRLASAKTVTPVLALGLVLLLTGFAFKITAAPFHYWVPDAYEGAPTPVTAFMSVGSKFAGFALALRIIIEALKVPLDWSLIFGVMAALSMFIGNLGAIRQTNIKRMLAYSGIAQAGYLLVGVAALSGAGISAVLFYAVAYTFANLAAFGAVMVVANSTGSTEIEDYAGLAKRSPLIALSLAVALLSLGGLPLMAGFMAKFYVFLSAVNSGLLWLVAIGVLNSVISLYYYLRVVYVMYVREAETPEPLRIDRISAAAMSFCVAGVLVLGILPETVMRAAGRAAASLFGG